MASAARKLVVDATFTEAPSLRVADARNLSQTPSVHEQQSRIAAAFAERPRHRMRAVTLALAGLACTGVWAAIIAAAIHVGGMAHP